MSERVFAGEMSVLLRVMVAWREAYIFEMALAAEEEEEEEEGGKACQLVKTRFQLVIISWRERARGGSVASSANWVVVADVRVAF